MEMHVMKYLKYVHSDMFPSGEKCLYKVQEHFMLVMNKRAALRPELHVIYYVLDKGQSFFEG